MNLKIGVFNKKGGVGKTAFSLGLAECLVKRGFSSLNLIDCNVSSNCLEQRIGMIKNKLLLNSFKVNSCRPSDLNSLFKEKIYNIEDSISIVDMVNTSFVEELEVFSEVVDVVFYILNSDLTSAIGLSNDLKRFVRYENIKHIFIVNNLFSKLTERQYSKLNNYSALMEYLETDEEVQGLLLKNKNKITISKNNIPFILGFKKSGEVTGKTLYSSKVSKQVLDLIVDDIFEILNK